MVHYQMVYVQTLASGLWTIWFSVRHVIDEISVVCYCRTCTRTLLLLSRACSPIHTFHVTMTLPGEHSAGLPCLA